MSIINDFLLNRLSTEGVKLESAPNLTPTPEGEPTISVKIADTSHGAEVAMRELDSLIRNLGTTPAISLEMGHDPSTVKTMMGSNTTTDDNYVVNGVFIPDFVASEKADVAVEIIRKTKKLKDMDPNTIYYVLDDYHALEIVTALEKEGFLAASTPIDLAKAIEMMRHRNRR